MASISFRNRKVVDSSESSSSNELHKQNEGGSLDPSKSFSSPRKYAVNSILNLGKAFYLNIWISLMLVIVSSFVLPNMSLTQVTSSDAYLSKPHARAMQTLAVRSVGIDESRSFNGGASDASVRFRNPEIAMSESDEGLIHQTSLKLGTQSNIGKELLETVDKSLDELSTKEYNVTKMLVHNGYLKLDVWFGTLSDVIEKILIAVKENNGYVESKSLFAPYQEYDQNRNTDKEDALKGANLQVRIPSNNFHDIIRAIQYEILESPNMVTNVDINSRDVTEEYVDIKTRLDVLEVSRSALKGLLTKAESVSDVLQIQREINRLTEDIESYRNRAQILQKQTAFSSLSLSINEQFKKTSNLLLDPKQFDMLSGTFHPVLSVQKAIYHAISWTAVWGNFFAYSIVFLVPIILLCLLSTKSTSTKESNV